MFLRLIIITILCFATIGCTNPDKYVEREVLKEALQQRDKALYELSLAVLELQKNQLRPIQKIRVKK